MIAEKFVALERKEGFKEEEFLRKSLEDTVKMLRATCKALEKHEVLIPRDAKRWWRQYKEEEKDRQIEEKNKRMKAVNLQAQLRVQLIESIEKALKKLTAKERKSLRVS